MSIPDIGCLIANRHNVIVVCLSLKQSITIFPLRTQPPNDLKLHRIIYIGHVYGNHFVQVFVIDLILSFNIIYYIMCSLLVVFVQVKLHDGCHIPLTDLCCQLIVMRLQNLGKFLTQVGCKFLHSWWGLEDLFSFCVLSFQKSYVLMFVIKPYD